MAAIVVTGNEDAPTSVKFNDLPLGQVYTVAGGKDLYLKTRDHRGGHNTYSFLSPEMDIDHEDCNVVPVEATLTLDLV